MQVTKKSMLSGKVHTLEIDINEASYQSWLGGMLIQDAFPHLSPDEREFLMTGATPEEWEQEFGDE